MAPRNTGRRVGGMRDGLRYVRGRPDLWFVIALAGLSRHAAIQLPITIALMVSDEFAADARSLRDPGIADGGGLTAGRTFVQARRARTDLRLVTIAAGLAALTTILAG